MEQLNFTVICTQGEELYPPQVPECMAMLQARCEGSNYTLPLCTERGVDECSLDNGGCGDPQYIACAVRLWNEWGTQLANLTKVLVPLNGTGNATVWETVDITFEENQTKIDLLFAAGGELFYTMEEVPLAIPQRGHDCSDINECLADNGGCGDPRYARCQNKFARPPRCRDINECEQDNGGCGDPLFSRCINHENHNTKDVVVTAPRNHTCRDIDECASNNGGCGDPEFFSCTNRGGENGGVFTPEEASARNVGPQVCDDIDECLVDNGSCGSDRYFECRNMWGAPPLCSEVCLSIFDPGFTDVERQGERLANFTLPGNPCAPNPDDFWECKPECIEDSSRLADHGCYGVYLANLRRGHDAHLRSIAALDAEYAALYPTRKRPTSDDPQSPAEGKLAALGDITQRCFNPLLNNANRTHEYRDLLPVLPCDVLQATSTVFGILDEYRRTCPMDGSEYDTIQILDERPESPTRNQLIDVNVTHTVCNNGDCLASLLVAAASLRPLLSMCRDYIATDGHYWISNDRTLRNCPRGLVGGRTYALLQTCAAPSYGPGPGLFPNPQIPCSSECNSLIRSEEVLVKDIITTPEANVDKDMLDAAFYQVRLTSTCSLATHFPIQI